MMELMKKELERLEVAENCEKPFGKKTKTYFTKTEENRSCYNNFSNKDSG